MLIATGPMLPLVVSAGVAPVVAAILFLAFRLSRNESERLASLVLAGVGAMAAALAVIFLSSPRPGSWLDDHSGLCMIAAMLAGATLAVSIGALGRRLFGARKPRRPAKQDDAGRCESGRGSGE
jgi:hypothetical protein